MYLILRDSQILCEEKRVHGVVLSGMNPCHNSRFADRNESRYPFLFVFHGVERGGLYRSPKMGAENFLNLSRELDNLISNNGTQVLLHVYDLTPINNYTYWFGFGIFHSGIEVHGKEYGFGAHDCPISGVFEVEPKSCPGFIYRCSISLGRVDMLPFEFKTFIERAASEYHGDTYHLISKNCNHFTDDMSWRLTGKHIPSWVNRLAKLGSVCSCLVPESIQVASVKHLPEYQACMGDPEDGESLTTSTTTTDICAEMDDIDQEKHLLSPHVGMGHGIEL